MRPRSVPLGPPAQALFPNFFYFCHLGKTAAHFQGVARLGWKMPLQISVPDAPSWGLVLICAAPDHRRAKWARTTGNCTQCSGRPQRERLRARLPSSVTQIERFRVDLGGDKTGDGAETGRKRGVEEGKEGKPKKR